MPALGFRSDWQAHDLHDVRRHRFHGCKLHAIWISKFVGDLEQSQIVLLVEYILASPRLLQMFARTPSVQDPPLEDDSDVVEVSFY